MDPGRFNDPVAATTQWSFIDRWGSNFRMQRLVEAAPDRLEFRTGGCGTAIVVGLTLFLVLPALAAALLVALFKADEPDLAIAPLAGVLIFALPAVAWFRLNPRYVFDRGAGTFWVGRKPGTDACPLHQIHALQLLGETLLGKTREGRRVTATVYQLNLVLKDGRRIPVVDYGNAQRLLEDAARVARLVGCKVWDATAPDAP